MKTGRRFLSLFGVIGVAGVTAAVALGAVSWGSAIAVPGLSGASSAGTEAISCGGAGTCAAGGFFVDGTGYPQPFVADETSGTWHNAIKVPGIEAIYQDSARVTAVSCASAGNCAAAGIYYNGSAQQAFVVDEKSGTWGNAIGVAGTAILNFGSFPVTVISCATAGNCAAGGAYTDASNNTQVFVVNEKNGVWGTAIPVPGSVTLNVGGLASLTSISCGGAGNCTAGGQYLSGSYHAWVASSKGGVWGKAKEVPGTATLNVGGKATVVSVSCPSAKACTAGGTFTNASHWVQSFVASGKIASTGKWVWSKAIMLSGGTGVSQLKSLSCRSATACSAGGWFSSSNGDQAFVANRTGGVWGDAQPVWFLGVGHQSMVSSISCASAGNCAATGYYDHSPDAFVVAETNGTWGAWAPIPGLSAAAGSDFPVSCAKASTTCAIGGIYYDPPGTGRAFVTSP